MNLSIKLLCEPQRTLAFGAIVAGYTGIGTSLNYPARMLLFQNLTNALLQFSFDGVNDNFPLPAGGLFVLDVTTNTMTNLQTFSAPKGQRFYVKQIGVPTSGAVYVNSFYGSDL